MSEIRIVEQKGSHLLIERNGRFAVIERRGNEVLGLAPGARREAPETPEGMAEVVGPAGWTGEGEARRLLQEVTSRGNELSRRIW